MTSEQPGRRRGWALPYAIAFTLVIVSAALLAVASLHRPLLDEWALGVLRITWWISGAAIVLAIAAVLLPGRRP